MLCPDCINFWIGLRNIAVPAIGLWAAIIYGAVWLATEARYVVQEVQRTLFVLWFGLD